VLAVRTVIPALTRRGVAQLPGHLRTQHDTDYSAAGRTPARPWDDPEDALTLAQRAATGGTVERYAVLRGPRGSGRIPPRAHRRSPV